MEIKRKYTYSLKAYDRGRSLYVRLRVSYPGNRIDFNTGCIIKNEEAWDEARQQVRSGYVGPKGEKAAEQNKVIQKLRDNVEDCFKYFEVKGVIPSVSEFKEYYNEKILGKREAPEAVTESEPKSESKTFWEIYDEFVLDNGVKNAWTKATYEKFAAMKADLTAYNKKLRFEDLTEKGLTEFVCYLRDSKKVIPLRSKPDKNGNIKGLKIGLKNTTIDKKLSYLKWFLKWATSKGYNKNVAYQTFKVTLKSTQKKIVFLTKDELSMLKHLAIPKEHSRYDRVRDVFLFCCFSGIRYSDAYNLKKSDIKDGFIEITTVKTADSLRIELNNVTKRILEKYENVPLPGNKALPVITNQLMNKYLKELCKLAGIDEQIRITTYKGNERIDEVYPKYELIGTHTARRTFICNMLSLGVAADIVMKWTGHSDYKAMKPYIDIVDQAKANEMMKINSLDVD